MPFTRILNVRFVKAFFALVLGLFGFALAQETLLTVWPLLIVYLMFVWKEFATHEPLAFATSSPLSVFRKVFVGLLEIALYFLLALSFTYPVRFVLLMGSFLLIEAAGYVLELVWQRSSLPLRRKVKMNVTELVLALATLPAMYLAYTRIAFIFWGILATDVTIYFVIFRQVGKGTTLPA